MRGLWAQYEVVEALIIRETRTRYGEHRIGYLWALLEPLFMIGTFAGMFYIAGRRAPPEGMTLIGFLATGFVPFGLFRDTFTQGGKAFASNRAVLGYPQIRLLDCAIARSLLELLTTIVVLVVIMGADAMISNPQPMGDLLEMILAVLLTWGLGASGGLVLSVIGLYFKALDKLTGVLTRPLFWTSGLFFLANSIPTHIREVMMLNPVMHTIDLTREGAFASYHSLSANWYYPSAWVLVMTFVGLSLEPLARKRLHNA